MIRNLHIDRQTLLGLVAILLWSSTVALARSIAERIGPITAGASVYLTAGLLLVCHLLLTRDPARRRRRLPRPYVLGCGALFVTYSTAVFLALGLAADRLQTIEVGLLNYLWPVLTLLFSLLILGKRGGIGLVPGTLLAVLGIFLVLTQGGSASWVSFSANVQGNPVVYGLGLVAAVSWALYSNLTRRWADPTGGGAVPLFVLVTGLVLLAVRLVRPEPGACSLRVVAEVGFLALATASAYVFWDIAMRQGDLVLVAACSYLTPFFSTAVSCLYLGVLPGIHLWLGCLLLIAGSLVSWRSIARREPAHRTPQAAAHERG